VGDAAAQAVGHGPPVIGREAERARVDAFAEAVPHGVQALVIRGEPGIGKTTLWRHAVEQCRVAGFQVLLTRPAEEEMPMALVGLVDLFEHARLDAAALDADADPLARGRAVLDGLRSLAECAPTVVAVDDAQWLDSGSARALRYALRRADAEPIGVLVTARSGFEDRLSIRTTLPPGCHETIDLGPLSLGALRRILGETVSAISRPVLRRIHEVSGGNPLYAIELVHAYSGIEPRSGSAGALPLPDSLQAAVAGRLETVPGELVPLLETVAGLGPTSVRELRGCLPDLDLERLLVTAERSGLILVEENLVVRFSHPVIASAVYGRLSPLARRSLHAHLASRVDNPDLRARHLALSTDGADAEVAALLEGAAERAHARGAFDVAADFARHSLRVTPPGDPDAARRRALAEIENLAASGEMSRALSLADHLVDTLPAGHGRAEALLRRAELEDDDLAKGEEFLLRALADAGDDDRQRGRVLDMLGWLRGVFRGDLRAGIECAREALAIAERAGDAEFQMSVAAGLSNMEALTGNPRLDLMDRAVALEEEVGRPALWAGPRVLLAEQLLWAGDLSTARSLLEAALGEAASSGNERWRSYGLYDLASVECAAGDLGRADELVGQAIEAARDSEDTHVESWVRHRLALVAAWLGRAEEARAAAARRLVEAERRGERPGVVRARSVLGLLALSEGDASGAALELLGAARLLDEMSFAHPGSIPVLPDAIEALAASGDVTAAEALLERLDGQGQALDSIWVRTVAKRCRGVLMLAWGDVDAAAALLEAAGASFDRTGHRPDAARAVLARGRALLRAGRRTQAADAFADARKRFATMGAALWEARAAEELERAAPGRAAGELTPVERRVAALVAEGMKNREIAQALYMSVATVEAHLTRIYRKLELRSRSELTRAVADGRVPLDES
jgi:DNA-binding CsgD family transcriptional regulator